LNILVISAQFPYPPRSGFATRVYQLARQLATRHRVTLLAYANQEELEGVRALGRQLSVRAVQREPGSVSRKRVSQALSLPSSRPFSCRSVHSRAMQDALDDLCSQEKFDVIQLESSLLCTFALPPGPRVILDEHNIEYEVFQRSCEGETSIPRRTFNRIEHSRFRRFEQSWWSRVDGCVVTSERERPVVNTYAPHTPVAVVPNSVDLEYFSPGSDDVEPNTVVFNGILTYRPNLEAAHYLVEQIWPLVARRRPDATLKVVGRASDADIRRLSRPGVVVTGEVPDIRPHLSRAAVVAVPVRFGGGTRLKVIEGLAMGKAMVSTSLGCEGIAVVDGEHLLVADGAQAFASRLLELFEDDGRRAALGRAGRGLAERAYSWELAGERLESLIRSFGDRQPPDQSPVLVRGRRGYPAAEGENREPDQAPGRRTRSATTG
jgi:glycosyltransferase involved in cell wall biosynthesis